MPIYFKACPRCNGDIVDLSDMHGDYLDCLQCGYNPPIILDERRKNNGISIDGHVEALWSLQLNGIISKAALSGDPNTTFLEERLENMAKYGYVEMSSYKENGKKEMYFKLEEKGKVVINAYRSLVRNVLKRQKTNGSRTSPISSYELVDEDGKLTLIGTYFGQRSPIIAQFVGDIYPMATISIESPETTPEKSDAEKQPVSARLERK